MQLFLDVFTPLALERKHDPIAIEGDIAFEQGRRTSTAIPAGVFLKTRPEQRAID
jgi:hypothetical protein